MDKEMYWHMSTLQPLQLIIDRGIALHKMVPISLATVTIPRLMAILNSSALSLSLSL